MGDCQNAMFGWNGGFETSSVTDAGRFRPVNVKVGIKTGKKLAALRRIGTRRKRHCPSDAQDNLPNCCQPDISILRCRSRSHCCWLSVNKGRGLVVESCHSSKGYEL